MTTNVIPFPTARAIPMEAPQLAAEGISPETWQRLIIPSAILLWAALGGLIWAGWSLGQLLLP